MRLLAVCVVVLVAAGCASRRNAPGVPGERAVDDGVYIVQAGFGPNNCADIGSDNVSKSEDNVHHFPCNGTAFQRWRIASDPERPGRYKIDWEGQGDKLWTVEHLDAKGDRLKFARENAAGTAFQRWIFVGVGLPNVYMIKSDGSGRCVDYNSSDNANGKGDIKLGASCTGSFPEFRWQLSKQ